jgi:hypothetical protein
MKHLLAELITFVFALVFIVLSVPVTVVGGYFSVRVVWLYLQVFARTLGIGGAAAPHREPPRTRTGGVEPAYQHYLFEQARRDLYHAGNTTITEGMVAVRGWARGLTEKWFAEKETWSPRSHDDTRMVRGGFGILLFAGLFAGCVGGAVLVAVLLLLQALTMGLLLAVGLAVAYGLREVDTVLLRLRGIRILCPSCFNRVVYPSYSCPGCATRHHDVRPGRYGVARRVCACGHRLPTLLLLGSHRMTAYCPSPGCGAQLVEGTGTAREVVLPMFGAGNAGKTRLMAVMVKAMLEMSSQRGPATTFADADTERRYRQIEPALLAGDPTRQNLRKAPRAYSLYVKPAAGSRRLVHVFDPSGEYFNETERLQELRYMKSAETFLFVVDPLSIDMFWNALPRIDQNRLSALRATGSPSFVFEQTLHNVEQMGVAPKRARLAVTVSKADLLTDAMAGDLSADSDSIAYWLESLGLGNMVRAMRHAFGDIRFFRTTAMLCGGQVDSSVENLLEWALGSGGVRLRATG